MYLLLRSLKDIFIVIVCIFTVTWLLFSLFCFENRDIIILILKSRLYGYCLKLYNHLYIIETFKRIKNCLFIINGVSFTSLLAENEVSVGETYDRTSLNLRVVFIKRQT